MAEITIRSVWAERAERDETTWTGTIDLARRVDESTEETLERIFRLFNRVTPADGEYLSRIGYRLPSLSEGDEVTIDGETWRVGMVGFEQVADRV
jgi:hypothetical protein